MSAAARVRAFVRCDHARALRVVLGRGVVLAVEHAAIGAQHLREQRRELLGRWQRLGIVVGDVTEGLFRWQSSGIRRGELSRKGGLGYQQQLKSDGTLRSRLYADGYGMELVTRTTTMTIMLTVAMRGQ